MTHAERWLAAQLLRLAADEFGQHGCNDYPLPDTPVNRRLLRDVGKWNGDDCPVKPSSDGQLYARDTSLMRYLAERLEEEVDG